MLEQLIDLIRQMLPGLSEEDQAKINALLQAYNLGTGGVVAPPEAPSEEMDQLNAQALLNALKALGFTVPEPAQPAQSQPQQQQRPPYEFQPSGDETDDDAHRAEVLKSIHVIRHGEIDKPTDLVMREVYSGDYRQSMFDQERAFWRWMRTGRDDKSLHRQLWSIDDVRSMLKGGFGVSEIRATMVEGMDELGGYAVPPDMQDNILTRVRGLTAVRGGGALVIQTASNMLEWVKITGGGDQYPSAMRGTWGDETTAGTADNFELGLLQIPVNIYSYPVDFSRSLLEDAANLEQVFTMLAADTLAIDEDEAFLVGEGSNKPRGILPGSTNGDSLTEKALSLNGEGDDITVEGVKGLRRGVASQYRRKERASWIGNSATAEDIELFQDGHGRFYFEYLEDGEQFMGSAWRESEAMPDVASNAYAMIFGDLAGYAIAERLGMSIDRFHDSNTGAKKFRFEIYRRIGGRTIMPWMLAAGKVAKTV